MYIQISFALGSTALRLVDYKSDIALVDGLCGYVLKGLEYYSYKPSPQLVLYLGYHPTNHALYITSMYHLG